MALWDNFSNNIQDIGEGQQPNDGTGDTIRDAFFKVDNSFGNVSAFLAQPTVEFLNANVWQTLTADTGNISVLNADFTVSNIINVTDTLSADTIVANTQIYALNGMTFTGNIVPSDNNLYDLGSPSNRIRTIYSVSQDITTQTTNTSDAGLLQIHANALITDTKDVGVFGNVAHKYDANAYAFFGFQYDTTDFVYKITNTDVVEGNSVVWDGIYGSTHFGSQVLSNTTVSTSTSTGALVVAGGTGIAGNLNVGGLGSIGGNLTVSGGATVGGYQVLTTNTPGITNYTGTLIAGNAVVTGATPSTSTTSGALTLPFGGIGVAGNINVGGNVVAAGLVGPYYGTVMTVDQPNITSLGTLGNLTVTNSLNAGSVSATSVGTQTLIVTSSVNFSGAVISDIQALNVLGTLSSGNVSAWGFTGNVSGQTGTFSGNVSASYILANAAAVTGLTQNSTIQTINANIAGANTAISTANLAMKNYVDAVTNAWTANANTQQITINTLVSAVYANANVANYLPIYSGNIAGGNLTVGSGNITVGNIIAAGNLIGNIGSSSNRFNTIFAKATSAQYADLAERYVADAEYAPGTVVVFGGEQEITVTTLHGDGRVAGAISTNPAYLMNDTITGLPLALRGRVPVKVIGPVRKGDSLVTSTTVGCAVSVGTELTWGQSVFAKSLVTDLNEGERLIEAVIL